MRILSPPNDSSNELETTISSKRGREGNTKVVIGVAWISVTSEPIHLVANRLFA